MVCGICVMLLIPLTRLRRFRTIPKTAVRSTSINHWSIICYGIVSPNRCPKTFIRQRTKNPTPNLFPSFKTSTLSPRPPPPPLLPFLPCIRVLSSSLSLSRLFVCLHSHTHTRAHGWFVYERMNDFFFQKKRTHTRAVTTPAQGEKHQSSSSERPAEEIVHEKRQTR